MRNLRRRLSQNLIEEAIDIRPIEALNEHERIARSLYDMIRRINSFLEKKQFVTLSRNPPSAVQRALKAIDAGKHPTVQSHGIEFPHFQSLLQAIAIGEEVVEIDTFSPHKDMYRIGKRPLLTWRNPLSRAKLTQEDLTGFFLTELFTFIAGDNKRTRHVFTVFDSHLDEKEPRSGTEFAKSIASLLFPSRPLEG